ncbi:pectate lyase [Aridibaculum aurantiacum]|uniref:pectate lyase n=1 Tax=Aridibaculum aurantiacum TaxID=2810307 RepID=UPI001A96F6C7|nr:pectate lyase [Aridibaculum aurantiacum]
MLKQSKSYLKRAAMCASIMGAILVFYTSAIAQDKVADNVLLFQRSVGGWSKHYNSKKVDYNVTLSEQEKKQVLAQGKNNDATIDNHSTVKEIKILLQAYKKHQNPAYLQAAERGIEYLLQAQYPTGGWPQFYPDHSGYRGQITYNDNAIANVLNLLQDVVEKKNGTEALNASFIPRASAAIEKGVESILRTQLVVNNKLSGWAAQYDPITLKPATARKYELPGLTALETVGIVEFLMRVPAPSDKVIQAVDGAVDWLKASAIKGYTAKIIADPTQPKGRDRVLVAEPNGVTWARYYEIDTNRPFFSGRDGVKKYKLEEIEVERRVGYGWYGSWPDDLLSKDYPRWKSAVSKK